MSRLATNATCLHGLPPQENSYDREKDKFEGCIVYAGKRVVFSFIIGVIRYCVALVVLTQYMMLISLAAIIRTGNNSC